MMSAHNDGVGVCETHVTDVNKDMIWIGLHVVSELLEIAVIVPIQFIIMFCQSDAVWGVIDRKWCSLFLFISRQIIPSLYLMESSYHTKRGLSSIIFQLAANFYCDQATLLAQTMGTCHTWGIDNQAAHPYRTRW